MNRIYRVVFNAKLGLWQVASESSKARKKSGGRKAALVAAATAAFISVNALAQGTITATGSVSPTAPSTGPWNISGALDIAATAGSTGRLEIKDGAEVNVTGVNSVTVGGNNGANGTLVVDGVGSVLNVRTAISVGRNYSKGALEVRNGGAINAANILLNESGEGGRLLVTGAGSTVSVGNTLTIMSPNPGDPGEVLIENGGAVTAKTVRIRASDGAEARVVVTGAGSSLTATDKILMDGEIPPSKGSVLVVQEGAKVVANSIDMNPSVTTADYSAAIFVGGETTNAADAKAAGKLEVGTISFGQMKGELNLNHTDANYLLDAALTSQVVGNHQQLNQISGHTTLTSDSSGFKGKTTVSGGTLIVQNALGGTAEVTSGTLQYGAAGVGGTSELSSLTVSGTDSALLIKGKAALNVSGQVAINNSAKLEMDVVPGNTAVVTADSFDIGAGTVLDISGITNVAQLNTDLVLFDTTSGIQNDFDSVIVHGYQPQDEDYLALNTRKSADGKQYVAKKGLSWTANNNLAHGNFTLNAGDSYNAGEDLKDEKANAVTGWDGKTLTKKGEGTLTLSGNNSYTGDTLVEGGTLQVAKNENLGDASSAVRIIGQNATLSTTGNFTTQRELDLQNDATVSVATNTTVEWNGTVKSTGTTLNKKGAGTLVLGGTNGAISHNIAEGKLQVGSEANLGTGTDAINLSGGTLAASESFTTAREMQVSKTSSIEVENNKELALSGEVTGAGDLVKTGQGTLDLQNTNNAYANTVVQAGTLKGNASTIKGNLTNNGVVDFNQATDATFSGNISGNGRLRKEGAGVLALSGQNQDFMGDVDVLGGKLVMLGGSRSTSVRVANAATLQYGDGITGDANTIFDSISIVDAGSTLAIYGPGAILVGAGVYFDASTKLDIKVSDNIVALTADEVVVGTGVNVNVDLSDISLAMNQEVVIIDTAKGITGDFDSVTVGTGGGSSSVDYLTVGVRKSADLKQYLAKYGLSWLAKSNDAHGTFTLVDAADTYSVTEVLGNENANTNWDGKTLTKKGAGTLTLSATNTYTGNTIIEGGTVSVASDNNLGAAAGNLVLNGGGLATTASFDSARKVELQKTGAVDVATGTTLGLTGTVEGAGGLTKAGAGKLVLTGTNTYAGGTQLAAGELVIAKNENLGDASGAVQVSGANTTLSTTGGFTTQRELDLQKDATVSVAANTEVEWNGTVKGTGTTLNKKGEGTLVLGGTNGAISHNIAEGTLQVSSDANLGTGTDAINLSGGTLAASSAFTTARDMLLSNTSGIDVASGAELALSGKVSGTGDLVKTGAGTLHLQNTGNAYGNTDVQAGLLKGEAASISGNLKNAGAVEFAQATDATFMGTISGTGSLAKTGAGTLTLNAQHTGSTVEVTGGTLQYGNGTTNAANNLTGDVNVSGTDSGLGVMGPATLTVAGNVNMADNTQLSLGAMSNGAVLTANEVNLGQNVSFMLNGVSQAGEKEILVIDTTTGITGDFASVNVGGASGAVDYLTVGTRKSTDQKQFFAKYGLSWLANNNNAHGTFTLATAAENFVVGVDLNDQTANPNTGWDGKTLTKAGAGTLVLSGNNSYTGDTLVQGGVLSISSNQNLGDASSNLVMNGGGLATTASFTADRHMDLKQTAAVDVAAGTAVDWQGVIDGAGGLTKVGAGTLVLSGANNYAGVTTIAGGTLQIDSDARLGTAPNMVFDGGGLATTATFNSAREIALNKTGFIDVADSTELGLQGEITGAGGLMKVGAGTLTLAGTNSYAGDTTLGAGITQISSDANLGANSGAVVFEGGNLTATASLNSARKFTLNKTGNVAVAAGATLGVDGVVAGKGDLLKTGQGTLTLNNTGNAYGNTLVQEGTLIAQADSVSGDIANAGTVVFDQAADASLASNIVALNNQKGTMVKAGQGNLTLAGLSTLDWKVDAGQLTTAAERFGGNANLASGATLAFNQTANADYAGQLAGTGEFRKQGAGSLQITGDSSAFNGHVNVESGVLAVNGKLGGQQATIADGATLAGNGTIGSGSGSTVTIAKGGVLSPGNSIDKLTVDGDLVFQSGSRFDVEVDPKGTASDLVHVTGNASLAGAVAHIGETGDYKLNAAYTILTADGSVTGEFDSVKSDFAFLNPELKYNYSDSEVQLILKRNGTTFDARGRTPNQRATARGLESMGSTSTHAVYTAIAKLPDNQAVIERSLDALSGEIYGSTKTALIDDSRFVRDAATDRMRSAFGGAGSTGSAVLADRQMAQANTTGTAAWAQTFGNWGDTDSDGNAHKLKRRTYGFLVGADTPLGDGSWRVGALAGYSHTKADADDVNSSNKGDNYHLGLYGGGQWDELGVRVGVAHSWHDMKAKRSVTIPGFSDDLKSSPKSRTTQIFADVGYTIDMGKTQLEPFANLAYVNLSSRSFNERGGEAALNVKSDNTNISYMTLGSRFSTEMDVGATTVMANASIGWRHAIGGVTPESTHRFSAGNAFTVYGVPLSRDSAVLEAGVGMKLSRSVTLGVSYQGLLGSDANDHGVRANLGIQF